MKIIIFLKKEFILKNNKYSNVNIKDIRYDDKDAEEIKTVSFKLEHNNQSTKLINLLINKFYSTNKFNELVESLTIDDLDLNIDSNTLPSNYNASNIQLKKTHNYCSKNLTLKLAK